MTGNRAVGLVVQDRDRRLLAELATMRLIDREQAKVVAGFRSTTRANTRLLALARAGLLRRFFLGTIAGGRKTIYTLSSKGASLTGTPYRPVLRSLEQTIVPDAFLEHQRRINAVYLTVKYQAIPGGRFLRWITFHRNLSPASAIVPDGYFEVEAADGIRALFLEVDLGTETLRTWRGKTQGYLQLAVSGEFERLFHKPRFRVLVVAPSGRRLERIRSVVARATDKIFRFATFDAISGHDFWSAIWLRPKGKDRTRIL